MEVVSWRKVCAIRHVRLIQVSVSRQAYIYFALHFRMSVRQGASREGFYTYTSLPWQGWLVVTFIQVGTFFLVSAQTSKRVSVIVSVT